MQNKSVNSLETGRCETNVKYGIFRHIYMIDILSISREIPSGKVKPAFVEIMNWYHGS